MQEEEEEEDQVLVGRLERLRSMVRDALENDMATTAVWYADKLVSLSSAKAEDVLLLARGFYSSGDYARAARTLETYEVCGGGPRMPAPQFRRGDDASTCGVELRARLLAARAWGKCKKYAEAAAVLEPSLAALSGAFQDGDDDDDGMSDDAENHEAPVAFAQAPTGPTTRSRARAMRNDDAHTMPSTMENTTSRKATPTRATRQLFGGTGPETTTTTKKVRDDFYEENYVRKRDALREEDEDDEDDESQHTTIEPVCALAEKIDLAAAACCCVGQAYEALENRGRAVEWLRRALRVDPRCAEALTFLVERKLLSAADERKLGSEVEADLNEYCEDEGWRAAVYAARVGVHDSSSKAASFSERFEALEKVHGLGKNAEVLCAKAEHAYYGRDARTAYTLTKQVYTRDPYDFACVPVYVASMVELGLAHDLFSCAHELVKAYPKEAPAWFAVGCYYLLVGKNDAAQRYFHKAAKKNPRFAPAWIGFGNAFAAQDESEQAMAAYRSASRLFQGSHLPLTFIGMEYLRTNNLPLAKHFLEGARTLCPSDPAVSNELGVVDLRRGDYEDAKNTFHEVLDVFGHVPEKAPLRLACEASIFNLAQTYRKLEDFQKAAHYFQIALGLKPRDPAVHAALASCHHVLGGHLLHKAIDSYHVALALRPSDTFAAEMLSRALKDVLDVDDPNDHVDLRAGPFHNLYANERPPTQTANQPANLVIPSLSRLVLQDHQQNDNNEQQQQQQRRPASS